MSQILLGFETFAFLLFNMKKMKDQLKKNLWKSWGRPEFPSEWDGNNFGGGKCSQMFWEYLFTIDNLPVTLNTDSIILDVGSGDKKFLPSLIRRHCRCIAVDPSLPKESEDDIPKIFNRNLALQLSEMPVNAVTCVSVLEHIADQEEFVRCLDIIKAPIILTFEFGHDPPKFDHQVTPKKLYGICKVINNHYVDRIEKSPILADNSDGGWWPLGLRLLPF